MLNKCDGKAYVNLRISIETLLKVDEIVKARKQRGAATVGNTPDEIKHAHELSKKHRDVWPANQYLKAQRLARKKALKAGSTRLGVLEELIELGLAKLEGK